MRHWWAKGIERSATFPRPNLRRSGYLPAIVPSGDDMALGDVPRPRPLPSHRIDELEWVVVAQRSQRVERIHDQLGPISSSRPLSNHALGACLAVTVHRRMPLGTPVCKRSDDRRRHQPVDGVAVLHPSISCTNYCRVHEGCRCMPSTPMAAFGPLSRRSPNSISVSRFGIVKTMPSLRARADKPLRPLGLPLGRASCATLVCLTARVASSQGHHASAFR